MANVALRRGESFEVMLKRFRKKVTRSRILSEVKKRRHYVSKSQKRHKAHRKAIARELKRQRKVNARLRRGW